MGEPHDWLPALIPWDGDSEDEQYPEPSAAYEEVLYAAYERGFVHSQAWFREMPVKPKYDPPYKGRCGTFWHVTSQTVKLKEMRDGNVVNVEKRMVRPRRCERIQWLRPMVDAANGNSDRVCVYAVEHQHGEIRWEIAITDFSYVVVLAERVDHYLLWTAHEHEKNNARRKARRKFEEWIETQKKLKPPSP
jgi:hypothetical protein